MRTIPPMPIEPGAIISDDDDERLYRDHDSLIYRPGERCPMCFCGVWIVGRWSVQCARCQHVLLLNNERR